MLDVLTDPQPKDFAYSRLLSYVKMQMPKYMIGRHHALIAKYLQDLEAGVITRLAIFMPPRHGKTLLASEYFSAWYLGRNPSHEVLFGSFSQDRADDVGKSVRNIMLSDTHEVVFPDSVLKTDEKASRKFRTKKNGVFYATGWGGPATGRGANCFDRKTIVETNQGPLSIEKIHNMKHKPLALSLNQFGDLCFSGIVSSMETKEKRVYEIQTRDGKKLHATADHRVYSRYKGYIEFKDIEVGDELLCCPSKNQKLSITTDVVSMAPRLYKESDTVYDIQVKKTHNFFANGVLVHNCLILDDLIKDRNDAQSKTNRRKREEWFSSTAYTRLMPDENVSNGRILLIMTRWAYDDIASFLLNEYASEKWHILNCPAIAEEDDVLGREPGDALWPEFRPLEVLESIKESTPSDDWNSLFQQRPLPKEGGLLKTSWFARYDRHELRRIEDMLKNGQNLPENLNWFKKIVISVDSAYKPNQINDPSAYTVWGYNKNRQYLLEASAKRLEFPQLKKWIIDLNDRYLEWNLGQVPILIEDAASGQSLIQVLRNETNIPIIAVTPDKSKIVRAERVSDYIESGRVSAPEKAPWLTDFETELSQFPYGKHDDQVDAFTQYLRWVVKPQRRKRLGKLFFK
jgi:predicted phage terminase large subunit-like protein